jgi:hypothetical protein
MGEGSSGSTISSEHKAGTRLRYSLTEGTSMTGVQWVLHWFFYRKTAGLKLASYYIFII